jgi:hypothetical protein
MMLKCVSNGERMILQFGITEAIGIAQRMTMKLLERETGYVRWVKRHTWTSRVPAGGKRWGCYERSLTIYKI